MARKVKPQSALSAQIIPSLGNSIPTKELIARLSKIADELSAVDQEKAVLDEYRDLAKNLANPKLIKHKNTGIQAFACCAISDIIRLYAPDAPFTTEELSDIFRAFFSQFSHLWDEENPYFLQQAYILKRLVEVRSVVLIGDLHDSQQLVSLLFETMYNLATKGFPSKLEPLASEMLAETISETDFIPQDVVSLIIKRLTVSADSQLMNGSSNISNPAFVFSLAICESNSDKMARSVAQLFSEMLDESAKLTHANDRRAPFKALEKIHLSSVQIWAHVPDLLASVMGLISDELNSDDENIRALATRTIGKMLSSSSKVRIENSAVTFVSYHRDTWTNWLKKSSDSSSMVRSTWVEQIPDILSLETTSEINTELSSGLSKCLIDYSEKVRLSTCKAIESLPFSVTLKKVCNASILKTFFSLIREKNPEIRNSAINVVADLYNSCMISRVKNQVIDLGGMDSKEYEDVLGMIVSGIPNNILQLVFIGDKSITTAVDIALFEKLLPFDDSAEVRVRRLCYLLKELEEKSKQAFNAIANRQKKNVDTLLKYLDLAEEYASNPPLDAEDKENSSSKKNTDEKFLIQVDKIVKWLSVQFPDGLSSYECIETFLKLRNMRFINLLKNCVNSQSDYKTVKNSAKELLSKLSDAKSIKVAKGNPQVSTTDMVSNFKILLYRSSIIFHNKSNITELIQISQDESLEILPAANDLINMISTNSPGVFKNHIKTLAKMVTTETHKTVKISLLRSLYHVLEKFPHSFPDEQSFFDRLHLLATEGSHLQAKYSLKIIGCYESKESLVSQVLEAILPLNPESTNFASHLSAVAETYLIDPFALASHSSNINSIIVEDVLKKNRMGLAEEEALTHLEWISDSQLEENPILVEKLVSIRLIANKLRYIASSETTDSATLLAAEKPINLFANIVSNNGEIVKASKDESMLATPNCYRSRLKLTSGLMLLKLAKYPRLNALISLDAIRKLTRLLLDENLQVREAFLRSLQKSLQEKRISERFLHLMFFMGHEPDLKLKKSVETWLLSEHYRSESKNDTLFEKISVRLIHAIAHDERFSKLISDEEKSPEERELEAYVYASKYVSMFINTIANEANINLLYYLASRVKQYRDNLIESSLYNVGDLSSEVLNLYRIAELFQLMLKELADSRSWNLQTWPGKINLPVDLYSPMEDYQQAQEFISRVYISDSIQIELREILSKKTGGGTKRRPNQSKKPQTANKVRKITPQKSTSKPRKVIRSKAQKKPKREAPSTPNPLISRKSRRVTAKVYYGESDDESELNESESESEIEEDEQESD
ncbi:hypothetical protein JCM33374_g5689 [Metschnikowia sp. JCM 33374]|nr:hypothetical protein JCM33374_g5689 [Metschnikowia sp. JCM 33374]